MKLFRSFYSIAFYKSFFCVVVKSSPNFGLPICKNVRFFFFAKYCQVFIHQSFQPCFLKKVLTQPFPVSCYTMQSSYRGAIGSMVCDGGIMWKWNGSVPYMYVVKVNKSGKCSLLQKKTTTRLPVFLGWAIIHNRYIRTRIYLLQESRIHPL